MVEEYKFQKICKFCGEIFYTNKPVVQLFCDRDCKTDYKKAGKRSKAERQKDYLEKIETWKKPAEIKTRNVTSDEYRLKVKDYYYTKKYGFGFEEAERRKAVHEFCDLCGEKSEKWVIDHCHATGVVRGFLCNNCNVGIAMFGDSIEKLKLAIAYLEKFLRR